MIGKELSVPLDTVHSLEAGTYLCFPHISKASHSACLDHCRFPVKWMDTDFRYPLAFLPFSWNHRPLELKGSSKRLTFCCDRSASRCMANAVVHGSSRILWYMGFPCLRSCPFHQWPFQAPYCTSSASVFHFCLGWFHTLGAHQRNLLSLEISQESFSIQGQLEVLIPFFLQGNQVFLRLTYFSKISITQVAALDAFSPRACAVHRFLPLHR